MMLRQVMSETPPLGIHMVDTDDIDHRIQLQDQFKNIVR